MERFETCTRLFTCVPHGRSCCAHNIIPRGINNAAQHVRVSSSAIRSVAALARAVFFSHPGTAPLVRHKKAGGDQPLRSGRRVCLAQLRGGFYKAKMKNIDNNSHLVDTDGGDSHKQEAVGLQLHSVPRLSDLSPQFSVNKLA